MEYGLKVRTLQRGSTVVRTMTGQPLVRRDYAIGADDFPLVVTTIHGDTIAITARRSLLERPQHKLTFGVVVQKRIEQRETGRRHALTDA